MNNYNVTVYNETIYGASVPEQKNIRAMNLESLYDLLKMKGYKRYFIGSLSEPCYEN